VIAMTRDRLLWAGVLVVALAVLGATIAVAATTAGDDHGAMMGSGSGMMGYAAREGGEPVGDLPEARRQAERFADRLDLRVGEVMQFSDGFYAELEEQNGAPATEILIDGRTGAVWFEYGPAMMWNTRYGMMRDGSADVGIDGSMMGWMLGQGGMMASGGMMGSGGVMGDDAGAGHMWTPGDRTGSDRPVTAAEARRIAQRWLGANRDGLRASVPEAFPGYYTLHVERDGRTEGMLSVNASTGAVWYHWWHGRFLAMDG
jgi:hypothetical protein